MNLTTLSRRATFALGAAGLLVPTMAFADARCNRNAATGEESCTAGLEGSGDTIRQLKPHWCWAACIETIFATHGYNVPQQRIVQKVFGNQFDEAANAKEILNGIDGHWTADRGAFLADGFVLWDRIANFERPDALATAVKELNSGNPLIFANDRHTMVLTSITYSEDRRGGINVESLTVRDPWPESPARHVLAPDEIGRSGLLCGVHVTPASTV